MQSLIEQTSEDFGKLKFSEYAVYGGQEKS
jgi:hypothetical protein